MSTVMVTGQASVSLYFQCIRTSTGQNRDGVLETAPTATTAGLKINYTRERAAMVSAVVGGGTAPVALASAIAAWTQWGFFHVGEGLCRVDYPDAAFLTGVKFMIPTITGMADTSFYFVGLVDETGTDVRSAAPSDVHVVDTAAGAFTAASFAAGALAAEVRAAIGMAAANFDTQLTSVLTNIGNISNLSAFANIFGPSVMEIPDAGTALMGFTVVFKDADGHLVDVDANAVTLAITNAAGVSRAGNLSAVTHPSTGVYLFTYTVTAGDAKEVLRLVATAAVAGAARRADFGVVVEDLDSVTAIGSILTNVATLLTRVPSLLPVATDYTAARAAKLDLLDSAVSAPKTLAGAAVTAVAAQITADHGSGAYGAGSSGPTAAQIADQLLIRSTQGGSDAAAGSRVGDAIASGGLLKVAIDSGDNLQTHHSDGSVAVTRALTRLPKGAIVSAT